MVCLVIAVGIILAISFERVLYGYELRDYGMFERVISQFTVILFYLKLIIFPNVAEMTLYHDGYAVSRNIDAKVIISFSVLLFLVFAALFSCKKYKYISLGIGIFFISHVLESTIIPLELVFEHRNYFALAGIVLAISFLGGMWLNRFPQKRVLTYFVTGFVLFVLTFQTHVRAVEWLSLIHI